MKLRGFITHKAAEYYSDCADYFRICPYTKRVAVSDGVSQSIMPAEWAKILVDSFVEKEWTPGESTASLKNKWFTIASKFALEQRKKGENPWLLENCLVNKDGAAATFCGVTFSDECKWTASILGDSALVEINNENQLVRICSSKEGAFDNRPDFFDSFSEDKGEIRQFDGKLNNGSKILIVSDPFSELFQKVKGTPGEKSVINILLSVTDITSFNATVDTLRTDYQMHNDDSTLVIIEPDESDMMTILYERTLEESQQEEELKFETEREKFEREKKKDEKLWEKVIEENNESAYRIYLGVSELRIHEKESRTRLNEIIETKVEDDTWREVNSSNTLDGYHNYIEKYPRGRYVIEAKERIANLSRPSIHGKRPEGKDNSTENHPSEEPFCKGGEKAEKVQHLHEDADMDKDSSLSSEKDSTTTSLSHVETEPKGSREEKRSTGEDPRQKGAELGPEQAVDSVHRCGFNAKEVEVNKGKEEDTLSLPSDVTTSDGIDKVEFQKLQEMALSVYKKHHDRFCEAFHLKKWKSYRADRINKCFADFWCELERIIYQNKK